MKQLLIIFSLLLCGATCSFGQNYRLVAADTSYYINDTGLVRAIYLDSNVVTGTDTLWYNFLNLIPDSTCFPVSGRGGGLSLSGSSWMGKSFGTKQGGYQFFINNYGDTIMFNTNAELNDSFTFYNYPNGTRIVAKMTALGVDTILGQVDSVKTFILATQNLAGIPISGSYDNKVLSLSKNHGLVKQFAFQYFPNDSITYKLTALRPMTFGQAYDFNVGDVVQTKYDYFGRYERIEYITSRYINVKYSVTHDSVTLTTVNAHYEYSPNYPDNITSSWDTTVNVIGNLNKIIFQGIPEQEIPTPSPLFPTIINWSKYDLYSSPNSFNGRMQEFGSDVYTYTDSMVGYCFYSTTFVGNNYLNYVKGLGAYTPNSSGVCNTSIVYFRKGNETWGTYFDYAGIDDQTNIDSWSTYPNPAKDKITFHSVISNNLAATIQLYNLTGQLMNEIALPAGQGNKEASMITFNLPDGLYIYHIKQGDSVFTGKVAIVK